MRRILAALSAAILVILGTASIVSAGGEPFTRSWSAIDVDGSVMMLKFVGNAATRTVTLVDARATTCGGDVYEARGVGSVDANEIHVIGTAGCVGDVPGPWEQTWTYQAASHTLTDGILTWHRGNRARESFLGAWKATDPADGSAMRLAFRGSGLTRTVSYRDNLASSCDPDAVFTAKGSGVIGSVLGEGRYITVTLVGACVGGASIDLPDAKYRYDYLTDTLRGPLDLGGNDLFGTVDWHRG
jgi:hypothetical protein